MHRAKAQVDNKTFYDNEIISFLKKRKEPKKIDDLLWNVLRHDTFNLDSLNSAHSISFDIETKNLSHKSLKIFAYGEKNKASNPIRTTTI